MVTPKVRKSSTPLFQWEPPKDFGPGPHVQFVAFDKHPPVGSHKYRWRKASVPRALRRITAAFRKVSSHLVSEPLLAEEYERLSEATFIGQILDCLEVSLTPDHIERLKDHLFTPVAALRRWGNRRRHPTNPDDFPDLDHVSGLSDNMRSDGAKIVELFLASANAMDAYAGELEKTHIKMEMKLSPAERATNAISETLDCLRTNARFFESIPPDVRQAALDGENAAVGKLITLFNRVYHPARIYLRDHGLPPKFTAFIQAHRSLEEVNSIQERLSKVLDVWDAWYEAFEQLQVHRNNLIRISNPAQLEVCYSQLGDLVVDFEDLPRLIDSLADWLEVYASNLASIETTTSSAPPITNHNGVDVNIALGHSQYAVNTGKIPAREPVLSTTARLTIKILLQEKAFSQGTAISSKGIMEELPDSSNLIPDDIKRAYRTLKNEGLIQTFRNGRAGGACLTDLGSYWAKTWFPDLA